MPDTDPKEVLEKHSARLMKVSGVVAVSYGVSPRDPDKRCILVHTTTEGWPPTLPRQLDGFDVEVVKVSGGFRAL